MAGRMSATASTRIFLIEDDPIVRQALTLILRQQGYDIVGEAGCAVNSSAVIKRLRPEIILLVINLPRSNGLEYLEHVRSEHPDVAVIMLSGDATRENVESAFSHGASGFIAKPFNAKGVLDAVKRVVADRAPAG